MRLFFLPKQFAVVLLVFLFFSNLKASCPVSCSTTGAQFCNLVTNTLCVTGNEQIGGSLTVCGTARILNTAASTGCSSGALVVSGGVGIGGNLNVCGTEHIFNTTISTGCTNGALVVDGGVGIGGNLNVCGTISASGGIAGLTGPNGIFGAAEFIRTIQSPNNSVPPGTAFTIDTELFNSLPGGIVASAGAGGTVFTLNLPGTYVFDYEMSLEAAGSVAIYSGATAGTLAIDTNTIAGSSTGTTWIHGRALVQVPVGAPLVTAVSSVVGTAAVVTAGNAAGFFVVRLTILKIS